ncbi:MAG: alpha/beta fold hydrolase [Candidatus Riflebacteria bacterium]|nr:alpha/beta fold hydrolase [Candidatus Riflebacteria bacterium]
MPEIPVQKFAFDEKFKDDLARAKRFLEYLQESSERGSRADEAQLASMNMARTPYKTLYSEGSTRLMEYEVLGGPPRKIPIFMVYSFINRWYILDLQPDHSFIEALSKKGFKVYLLDWGIPGLESAGLGLEYYLEKVAKRAVQRIRRKHSNTPINLFGYCLGGTLAAIMASLHPEYYASQILLTTPIKFKNAGILSLWTNKDFFDPSKLANAFGCIPEEILHAPFPLMRPKDSLARPRVLFDNILSDSFLENFRSLDRWATDNVPFPGKVFQEFIKYCYQNDLLAEGKMKIGDTEVDLSKIKSPTLNIFATQDHIVPPDTARESADVLTGCQTTNREYPVGHLTVTVGSPVREQVWSETISWLEENGLA